MFGRVYLSDMIFFLRSIGLGQIVLIFEEIFQHFDYVGGQGLPKGEFDVSPRQCPLRLQLPEA